MKALLNSTWFDESNGLGIQGPSLTNVTHALIHGPPTGDIVWIAAVITTVPNAVDIEVAVRLTEEHPRDGVRSRPALLPRIRLQNVGR